MITMVLTAAQRAVVDDLARNLRVTDQTLDEATIEDHDEDVIAQLFRMKVLQRLPKRPRDPQRYKLVLDQVFSDDPEVQKEQLNELTVAIITKCLEPNNKPNIELFLIDSLNKFKEPINKETVTV